MDMTSRMTSHFRDAMAACEQSMNVLAEPLAVAVDVLFGALANNGKILACGNGGSAADAQHFIAELVGRFERERDTASGFARAVCEPLAHPERYRHFLVLQVDVARAESNRQEVDSGGSD